MNTIPIEQDERAGVPSASKFERLAACPGSRALEESLPPEVKKAAQENVDEVAESGTIIHRARETGNTLELDRDQTELYSAGMECEKKIVAQWRETYGINTPNAIQEGPREDRLWLNDNNTLAPILSAKLDVHYLAGKHALIIDWKTGFSPNLVASKSNWQLRVQSLLLKLEHPELEVIRAGFCKPRSDYLDFTDYTEQDLKHCYDAILLTLWLSEQPDAPRVPGPAQCRYCTGKDHCPEAGAFTMLPSVIAKRVPDSGLMPWPMMVEKMTGPDLYRIWEMAPIIEKIVDAVKDRLKGMPAEQLTGLGLMLPEKGSKNNSISNMPGAFQTLLNTLELETLLACMTFQSGKLVEAVRKEKGLGKEAAESWLDTTLDEFIKRDNKAPSLRKIK
jgi:hypothetical protein